MTNRNAYRDERKSPELYLSSATEYCHRRRRVYRVRKTPGARNERGARPPNRPLPGKRNISERTIGLQEKFIVILTRQEVVQQLFLALGRPKPSGIYYNSFTASVIEFFMKYSALYARSKHRQFDRRIFIVR